MKKLQQYICTIILYMIFFHDFSSSQQLNWQNIGPSGGNIEQLVTAKSDSNIVYAALRDGSIFRSSDSGTNWILKSWHDGIILSIIVHPLNEDEVYIVHSSDSARTILKSIDGGNSWFNPQWNLGFVLNLAIHSKATNRMYVAAWNGLYLTTDSGEQWILNDSIKLRSIYISSNIPNLIYGFSNEWKFYRSLNYGLNWSLTSNLEGTPLWLAIDPLNNSVIYLATSEGVFKSINMGTTWLKRNGGEINSYHPYSSCLVIDPNNNNKIFRSDNHEWTTFISTNGGEYWKKINLISGSLTITGGENLLSGTRNGVYTSSLTGQNILYTSNGLNAVSLNQLTANKNLSNNVFASYWDQGQATAYIYQLSDSGIWKKNYFGKGISTIALNPKNLQLVAAGLNFLEKGIKISFDNGITWEARGPSDYIYFTKFSSRDSMRIYAAGYNYIYKSSNLGIDWEVVPTPLTAHSFKHISFNNQENQLVVSCYKGYDWTLREALLVSMDGGVNWEEKNIRANISFIYPSNPEIILIGTNSQLYRSIDYGISWNLVPFTTNITVNSFQFLENDVVVMGTSKGLYYSKDMGETWIEISTNLLHKHITSLAYVRSPEKLLYVSTISGSIYCANISSITDIKEDISIYDYFLSQNFPNPFNPNTRIQYQVSRIAHVTLKVYDVLGNEVATLVDEHKPAGSYESEFDASSGIRNLVSGIYMYQLRVGEFVQTKKMLYLK